MATRRPAQPQLSRRSRSAPDDLPLLEDDARYDPMAEMQKASDALKAQTTPKGRPVREVELGGMTERSDGSVVVDIEEEAAPHELVERPDGSVLVVEHEETSKPPRTSDHLANLAEELDPAEANSIALELIDLIERDIEDRGERDKIYAEGLERSGLGKDAPGGANFQGASKVVHPMITEACVDFASRVMKEVFPAKGPVKAHVIGTATREKIEKAERKKTYMNWQTTKQIREFRNTFEVALTQTPLGGSQYIKVWYDERVERPRTEFVPIDKFVLPYAAASDLDSAERKTHIIELTRREFDARVKSGLYSDVVKGEATEPEPTAAQAANDRIEGKTSNSMNQDGLRTLYETYVMLDDVGGEEGAAPYIATLDKTSGRLVALYRNWAENDAKRTELDWFAELKFIPWRGPYGLGLIHIAGSLAAGATGALRALLDSAHIKNFPGVLKLKGARMSGQSKSVEPTQVQEVDGPVNIDDVRKLAMPLPYGGPDMTLFELLKFMVESGRGVIATAEDKIADVTANAPVGTTLAAIEQGSVTYSAVHSRIHRSMEQILAILHRLDSEWLDDEVTVEELGELVVRREDFRGPMDVVPVSDPNIFSETQRYAQLQAVLGLRTQFAPGSFKDNALLEQSMRLLNYPNYEDVLNVPLDAEERDALTENYVAGDPQSQLEAYDAQDHLAHLKAHVTFMGSPIFSTNPLMAAPALPKLLEHCKQHLRMYYYEQARGAATAVARSGAELELTQPDAMVAAGAALADEEMARELGPIIEALLKVQQQVAQLMPPPPDPAVAVETVRSNTQKEIEANRLKSEESRQQRADAAEAARQQAEDAAEQARQQREEAATAARHTEEMAVANRNAQMAEESERRKQERDFLIERFALMQKDQAEQLAAQMKLMQAEMDNRSREFTALITSAISAQAAQATATDSEGKPIGDASKLEATIDQLLSVMQGVLAAQRAPRKTRLLRTPQGFEVERLIDEAGGSSSLQ